MFIGKSLTGYLKDVDKMSELSLHIWVTLMFRSHWCQWIGQ